MIDSRAHLLIVDDDATNRHLLCTYLRKSGYEVTGVSNGPAALSALDKESFDLVLLDKMMPGLSGMETLERIRSRPHLNKVPVVMATARSAPADVVEALHAGAIDYITKPFDMPVLLQRIEKCIADDKKSLLVQDFESNGIAHREPSISELAPGVLLAGRYRLQEPIGSGNYGTVYRGQHVDLERPVAIKVLQISEGDEDALKRFRLEGVSACRIQHPNAVDISDFSVTKAGVAYLVMELLEGEDLGMLLKREGKLSCKECAKILLPICFVLAEAHARGIIHRDIKPANIFLAKRKGQQVVKVLDFGIAKFVGEESQMNAQTQDCLLGTPAYMAPERVKGEPYDGRADVYALGIMLYEMLSGTKPFNEGDPIATAVAQVQKEAPVLDAQALQLRPEVVNVIQQAMHKDPARRPSVELLAVAFSQGAGVKV